MKKNRIIVYVEGGVVQAVMVDNDKDIDVQIFDVDNRIEDNNRDEIEKDWQKLTKGMKAGY